MSHHRLSATAGLALAALLLTADLAAGQVPVPHLDSRYFGVRKVSATQGGLAGPLDVGGEFGGSVASLGDLDGDGVVDLAVGNMRDSELGPERGAVWILFMDSDGRVRSERKLNDASGDVPLVDQNWFGSSVAAVGDLNFDGVPDLAVGAMRDSQAGFWSGAVWVFFLGPDGSVKYKQKITAGVGGLGPVLSSGDYFGSALAATGDLNSDGYADLAVGAMGAAGGGVLHGAVHVLLLTSNGTVLGSQVHSDAAGGSLPAVSDFAVLGSSVCAIGDVNGDGRTDLAIGAPTDLVNGATSGSVVVALLGSGGTVLGSHKLGDQTGGFGGAVGSTELFGSALLGPGDVNGDGSPDLVVGGRGADVGSVNDGRLWLCLLDASGQVLEQRAAADLTAFKGKKLFKPHENFGSGLALGADWDLDGHPDLVVGAQGDHDGASPTASQPDVGALWLLGLADIFGL